MRLILLLIGINKQLTEFLIIRNLKIKYEGFKDELSEWTNREEVELPEVKDTD